MLAARGHAPAANKCDCASENDPESRIDVHVFLEKIRLFTDNATIDYGFPIRYFEQ
jgi:hypothetical protein